MKLNCSIFTCFSINAYDLKVKTLNKPNVKSSSKLINNSLMIGGMLLTCRLLILEAQNN